MAIKRFFNQTTAGHEEAIRRGKIVPGDAINLAWIKSPTISPDSNMVVIDTSALFAENTEPITSEIVYADELGILQDANGNQVIADEYPAVTDEFTLEGNLDTIDLSAEYILPYVHVSRYFHLDFSGLVPGTGLMDYTASTIKVVDSSGNRYADSNGNSLYAIKIVPVYQPWPGDSQKKLIDPAQATYAYRVYAFINSSTDDYADADLYLTYNKVEIANNGTFINQDINHREILNPQPYFEYRPQKAEVVDPANRDQKWYSTESVTLRKEILNLPVSDINGYKVYAPQKAIMDPRIFQLFRWRVTCTFSENIAVNQISNTIKCGIVTTTNQPTSPVAQLFNIIAQQPINLVDATFVNPTSPAQTPFAKASDDYWYVNFDTITNDQLAQFDLLIWAPTGSNFDFSPYSGKIHYFTQVLNKVLLIDTDSFSVPQNLGFTTSSGTTAQTGQPSNANDALLAYAAPTSVLTWVPQLFLGILNSSITFNPPPPPNSEWISYITEQVPSTGAISYVATDGITYWKSSTLTASVLSPPGNEINDSAYANQISTEWNPPVYIGINSSLPNPPPPMGSAWISTTVSQPSGPNYLSYKATDENTYWAPFPFNNTYATTGPAVVVSGDNVPGIVSDIKSWYGSAYPNYSSTGIPTGTNMDPSVATALEQGTPAIPGLFIPGSTLTGFLPFSSKLRSLGYPLISVDTYSGSDITLVESFQTANSISASGNVDTATWNAAFSGIGPPQSTSGSSYNYSNQTPAIVADNAATYSATSSLFNGTSLQGWLINNADPISYYQTAFGLSGGFVQYILGSPQGFETLVSGQVVAMTTANASGTTNVYEYSGAQGSNQAFSHINGNTQTASTVGPIPIELPTIPAGATLAQLVITTTTNYNQATGGFGVLINGAPSSSIGALVTSQDPQGVLTQTCVITNGSNFDLGTASLILSYTNGDAFLGDVYITATAFYYAATSTTTTTTTSPVQFPVFVPVPLMVQSGSLLLSTLGIPESACALVAGGAQLMLNIALYATSKRPLEVSTTDDFASNFFAASNWQNSWVINATDFPAALNTYEKNKYDFSFLPTDFATPVNVWQRQLSNQNCKQLVEDNVDNTQILTTVGGATRTYAIEVTNSLVEVPVTLGDDSLPYAWTRAYTPTLSIPPDIKTYIIREREIRGDYGSGTYVSVSYPSLPYRCQVRSYLDEDNVGTLSTNWSASGTALLTYNTQVYVPPKTITTVTPTTTVAEVAITAADHGYPGTVFLGLDPYFGEPTPAAITTYQEQNYHSPTTSNCWPYFGIPYRYEQGDSGDVVKFIQDALNYFGSLGYMANPNLAVDGSYGANTANAIATFQRTFNAIFVDGVVDAETWSLIASQIIRSGRRAGPGYQQYYGYPYSYAQKGSISDGSPASVWGKRSWFVSGPSYIWDIVAIRFDQPYSIHGITVNPWVFGNTPTIVINGVSVQTGANLQGYNPNAMMISNLGWRGSDNNPIYIPFGAVTGDTILVQVGQDGPDGFGSERVFGVRDISANASIATTTNVVDTVTIPGYYATQTVKTTISVQATGNAQVNFAQDYIAQVVPNFSGNGTLSNVEWTSVSVGNPEVIGTISNNGLMVLSVGNPGEGIVVQGAMTYGSVLPFGSTAYSSVIHPATPNQASPTVYSMTPTRKLNPIPETGFISKPDGIKLLCDINKNPVGFPPFPTASTAEQVHFVDLSIISYDTNTSIQVSFYDVNTQEFIVDANGLPRITYQDYISRGPHNIYVGIFSAFEVDIAEALPGSDNSPPIPNTMVMPAYGLQTNSTAKIKISQLPPNLGPDDIWPIPVQTGKFFKNFTLPPQNSTTYTNYLSNYQGTEVLAYYAIPEALQMGWSALYGPPNIDVVDEFPIILDLNTIQVLQPPILMVKQPTIYSSLADPIRPIFTVSIRSNVNNAWTDLGWDAVQDYDVSEGIIYLNQQLYGSDPNLVKVSYTSIQNTYLFKEYNGTLLNLNPYSGQNTAFVDVPIYIYIVPQYVLDTNGNIIAGSQQTRTLRYSLDTKIFDPLDPSYDPTAFRLGIIYVTNDVDIANLTLIDSRRRGGGARDSVSDDTLSNILSDTKNYWDVDFGTALSYQDGGFIVVRLPTQLHDSFTEQQIEEVISRNISAGVQFKIEDLQGNPWS